MGKRLTALIFVALALSGVAFYSLVQPGPALEAPRLVEVKRDEHLRTIARDLERAQVVRSALALLTYARLSGAANRLQPGDYKFSGGETIAEVLGHIVRGESIVITVAIPRVPACGKSPGGWKRRAWFATGSSWKPRATPRYPKHWDWRRSEWRAICFPPPTVSLPP